MLPTGTVRFLANAGCYLGELPAGTSARVQTLADTFDRVGIRAKVAPHIQSVEWSKYLYWVCLMAPAVLTRWESYKVLQEAHTASIMVAILQEMAQLATARGIVLDDLPFFPTKTLSQLAFDDRVTHLRQMGDRIASRNPTVRLSPVHDLERGRRLEVEETLGYAVRHCAALGIPTPTMEVCY